MFKTRVCDILGIDFPIVLAGMGGASTPELAAAVNRAVEDVLDQGARTADLAKPGDEILGTRQMGDQVLKAVEQRLS